MKKKIIILIFVAIIVGTPLINYVTASTTETVFDERALIFDSNSVNYYTDKTPATNTEVSIEFTSTQPLTFFVCDEGSSELYAKGYEISMYKIERDLTDVSITFNLKESKTYEFAFDNPNTVKAYVNLKISFTYKSGMDSFWIVPILFLIVAGLVIFSVIRNKRNNRQYYTSSKQQKSAKPFNRVAAVNYQTDQYYQAPQGQNNYYPNSPNASNSYYPQYSQQPQAANQDVFPQNNYVGENIYCSECGAKNSSTAKFCINCGAKLLP